MPGLSINPHKQKNDGEQTEKLQQEQDEQSMINVHHFVMNIILASCLSNIKF